MTAQLPYAAEQRKSIPITSSLTPWTLSTMSVNAISRDVSPIIAEPWGTLYSDDFTAGGLFYNTTGGFVVSGFTFGNNYNGYQSASSTGAANATTGILEAIPSVNYCTALIDVDTIPTLTGGQTASIAVGLYSNLTTGDGIRVEYQIDTNTVSLHSRTGGVDSGAVASAVITPLTTPFCLAVSITGRGAAIWVKRGHSLDLSVPWECYGAYTITQFDMRLKSWLSSVFLASNFTCAQAATFKIRRRALHLFGQVGWRETSPVVDLDGTPCESADGKYYVLVDCIGPAGSNATTVHDPFDYDCFGVVKYDAHVMRFVQRTSAIFYDDGTRIGGIQDGFLLYDQEQQCFWLYFSLWYAYDQLTACPIMCVRCDNNILNGMHILSNATTVTLPSGYIYTMEDPSVWRDTAGVWWMAFTTYNIANNPTFAGLTLTATLAKGTGPTNFPTLVGSAVDHGEGTSLMHFDTGTYLIKGTVPDGSGTNNVQAIYDLSMTRQGSLPVVSNNTGLTPEWRHLPVRLNDGTTAHHFLGFSDLATVPTGSLFSVGPLIVQKAIEKSTGWLKPRVLRSYP